MYNEGRNGSEHVRGRVWHGAGSARKHEAVADLIVVKERLVILVHLAGLQLSCARHSYRSTKPPPNITTYSTFPALELPACRMGKRLLKPSRQLHMVSAMSTSRRLAPVPRPAGMPEVGPVTSLAGCRRYRMELEAASGISVSARNCIACVDMQSELSNARHALVAMRNLVKCGSDLQNCAQQVWNATAPATI